MSSASCSPAPPGNQPPPTHNATTATRLSGAELPQNLNGYLGLAYAPHRSGVGEELQGLLEVFEVLHVQDDRSGPTVLGDDDTPVLALQPLDDFGESVLQVSN